MSLALNSISQNFFTNKSGLISGDELKQVVSEILSTSSTQSAQNTQALNTTNNINTINTTAQLANQVANNQAALNISLSQRALSSIDALKAQAAQTLASNSIKLDNAPSKLAQTSDIQAALAPKKLFDLNVSDMTSDKNGSNSSYFNNKKSDDQKDNEHSINFFL